MALAILLMSTTPSLAGSPKPNSERIRKNPFCDPAGPGSFESVQLASGAENSTIRLKPIGKAIGLKTLQEPEQGSLMPQQIHRAKMTIEAVPSIVRINPLIDSIHHADRPLVDTEVTDTRPVRSGNRNGPSSTIMLKSVRNPLPTPKPPAITKSMPGPAVEDISTEASVLPARAWESTVLSDQIADVPLAGAPVSNQNNAQLPYSKSNWEEQQPIQFSLSDRAPESVNESGSQISSELIDLGVDGTPLLPAEQAEEEASPEAAPATEAIDDTQITFEMAPESIVAPRNADPSFDGLSVLNEQVRNSGRVKGAKRYRPPVAVKTVPLEIERMLNGSAIDAPARAVPEFEPSVKQSVSGSGTKLTALELNLAQARSLTVGGELRAVRVADTSVCKAVTTGPRELKLIGTGEGVTQLVVLADGQEPGAKPRQRAFEIHVSDVRQTSGKSLHKTSELLNHSIRETFPGCDVVVLQRENELVVAGRCDSQSSAKKILRMVRKTCLVRVKDEVIVE
jgi:hypothetical protein